YLPNDNINIRLGIINYKEKKLLRRSTQHSPPQYNIIGKVENDSGPRLIRNTKYYKDTAVAAELFDMQLNRIKKYSGVLLQSNPPGAHDGNSPNYEHPFYFGTGSTRMLMVLGANFAHIPGTNSAVHQPYFSRLNLRDSSAAYRIFPQTQVMATGTVFDFNDDGIPEAVLMAQDTLYILDADGNTLGQYAMPTGGQGGDVTIADVDKDGKADIVVGITNPRFGAPGMMVFSNPTWVGARGIYNQLDYTVTNVDDDGRIPRFPTPHWEAKN